MSRHKRKPMAQINVVPYIDVMLVLLIIFMVTAPMMTQGVKLDLPKSSDEPINIEDLTKHIEVSVNAEGQYFIQRSSDEPEQVELALIGAHVNKIIAQSPEMLVLVRGDQTLSYGKVMQLVSTLKEAGVPEVGLVTEPETN